MSDTAYTGEVARLIEHFRVVAEGGIDPRQWILQRRKIVKGAEAWSPLSFCTTRDGLLLAIREKCIPLHLFKRRFEYPGLDPAAMRTLKTLSARFERRKIIAEVSA